MSGGIDKLSNVAYKKGSWMRYTLWGIGATCVIALFAGFIGLMNKDANTVSAPAGYRFAVTDDYATDGSISTTYYVYDNNKIIVQDKSLVDGKPNVSMFIYDGISTATLALDEDDTTELCELGVCSEKPKILVTLKRLVSNKIGREYIGL